MNKQRTQTRNRTRLVATVALAAVTLGYVFFVFLPKQETIAEMRRELNQRQEFLLQVDRLRHSIRTVDEELTLAANYSQHWEDHSPSAITLADFYEKLSTAAAESGVVITKFNPQPVENMAHLCQLPVELSSEGTFGDTFQFLSKIETLETTIWLESLAIQRLEKRRSTTDRSHAEGTMEPQMGGILVQCQIVMKVFANKSEFSD